MGGWYVGGTYTSVGEDGRSGLAHLLPSGMLDTAFVPPKLGQVRALALDAGRLYVGGVQALHADSWFLPVLSAVDPATGALLPVFRCGAGRRLAFVRSDRTRGRRREALCGLNGDNGIAAYDEGTGTLLSSQPGTPSFGQYSGPAALALAGGKLLAGGQISTPAGSVNLEELGPATGAPVGQLAMDGPVAGMTTGPTNAYLLVRSPNVSGLSVWKLGLSSGTLTRLAIVRRH